MTCATLCALAIHAFTTSPSFRASHHVQAFAPHASGPAHTHASSATSRTTTTTTGTVLSAVPKRAGNAPRSNKQSPDSSSSDNSNSKKSSKKKKNPKTFTTLSSLTKSLAANPDALRDTQAKNKAKPKGKSGQEGRQKRTRKSVRERGERPKQVYVYAAQRKKLAAEGNGGVDDMDVVGASQNGNASGGSGSGGSVAEHSNTALARQLGMRLTPSPLSMQGCYPDASTSAHAQPRIVGEVCVVEDDDGGEGGGVGAGGYAYVLYKPAGWCLLEGKGGDPRCRINSKSNTGGGKIKSNNSGGSKAGGKRKLGGGVGGRSKNAKDSNDDNDDDADDDDTFNFSEADLAGAMTPEELAEFRKEGGMSGLDFGAKSASGGARGGAPDSWFDDEADDMSMEESNGGGEMDLSSVLSPEELAEMEADGSLSALSKFADTTDGTTAFASSSTTDAQSNGQERPDALTNLKGHPSLVSWLKDHMAAQGTPIRGGKYWRAVAGAVDIDDSGFVVLCPKDKADNVYVDFATYVAVVGNSETLAPRGKIARERLSTCDKDGVEVDIVSKLRTGRGDDAMLTAAVTLSDGFSSTSDVVKECQSQFNDGIRGDPSADPLDRRAQRRLLHCGAISVSSLVHDDDVEAMEDPPDDMAILSERGEWGQDFVRGSYLGRTELRNDELTTAYREINGAADGYPGWIVDRYDKWLSVQHDESASTAAGIGARGPLPSIHDDNTAGVYYFSTNPDRSTISTTKPILLEGQAAPDVLPVKENGITYHVNLDESFSTGIFLDQRPQRAWLARHCDSNTRVLNCFAHCGAFSIAAATAGASTVSLDLDKKWLDRIQPQMEANGITDFEDRHDCIYGDCFDWLARLGKRGEQYDIVILDPPSTSVGGKKKKRWSVKQDMDELVALAAPLVKSGGLLWTTTNSASIRIDRFAKMCKKGLDAAGCSDAKLEKIAPMAVDYSSIGPQPVKNLVWRL